MSVVRIPFAALIAAGIAQPVLAGAGLTSPDDSKSAELNNVMLKCGDWCTLMPASDGTG